MIRVPSPDATHDLFSFATRDELVRNLQSMYESVAREPYKHAGDKLYVFEGRLLRITGNPSREIVFADGTRVGLSAGPPRDEDDDPYAAIPASWYAG